MLQKCRKKIEKTAAAFLQSERKDMFVEKKLAFSNFFLGEQK